MSFDIVRLFGESMTATLGTRLDALWREQNPLPAKRPEEVSVKFNVKTLQRVVDELSRNTSHAIMDIVEMAQRLCQLEHTKNDDKSCREEYCPFYVNPEDASPG